MSATAARTTTAAPPPAAAGTATWPRAPRRDRLVTPLSAVELSALIAAVSFGAQGATGLGSMTTVEIVLILLGGAAGSLAILVAPVPLRLSGAPATALFALLAALTALSITWAINPDDAWLEANRTIAY